MKPATHRGNCQVCGRQHHVMGVTLAKHGYTVEFGYFSGTCCGSDRKPVQTERTLTDATIDGLGRYAVECDESAAKLKAGTIRPSRIHTGDKLNRTTFKYEPQYIDFAAGTPEQQAHAVELAVAGAESDARGARAHALGLKQMADKYHGTALVLIWWPPVKAAPEAKPIVDVKTATVSGTFKTKAARKEALDSLNRRFDKARDALQDLYLAIPNEQRTEAQTAVYYGPMQLNHWRPKHSAAALKEFPFAASIVQTIEELVAAREAVKAAP